MSEITLEQMLKARDDRVTLQKKLLSDHKCPLICFTMNIAGPIKTSPLIKRAFMEGIQMLDDKLQKEQVSFRHINFADTGFEAMLCVKMNVYALKKICTSIEESTPLGRLFDMDVIKENGEKLERKTPRNCLVCGAHGRYCSARRIHSVLELQTKTNEIISDYFKSADRKKISDLAAQSLLDEVNTTPKPGLVDRRNNGSHKDMDIGTFIKSITAIKPYFEECVEIGQNNADTSPEKVFSLLRKAGFSAENQMFSATNGVNTHKGIIYSMGILCGGLGMLWSANAPYPQTNKLLSLCSDIVRTSVKSDFASINNTSAGGRLFLEFGLLGIRGEVRSGFPSVSYVSLPIFQKSLSLGLNPNDAGILALLHLISHIEDTNLYNRGGKDGALFAKNCVKNLLASNPYPTKKEIEKLDDLFISKNLSPGGCADLLAITYFLHSLKSFKI